MGRHVLILGQMANYDLDKLLTRPGLLAAPGFEPCVELRDFLKTSLRVLVVGAGGLGCEILHSMVKSGFGQIDIIDLDTIDGSNLNRQFLFRAKDVGKYKAEVAAEYVNARCEGVKVTPHTCKIQEKDDAFYRQFNLVIAGLDSIKARAWLSAKLVALTATDAEGNVDMSTLIPIVDGGTESFKGQARTILPRISACFQCSISAFPPQRTFQLCTIASTPRTPAHLVAYAMKNQWEEEFGDRPLDKDSVEDVTWVMNAAKARGEEFGIGGVTYSLTQGVMKNIIPAIASTNALIAGACVLEALKLATNAAKYLDNWFMFIGDEGINTSTFKWEKDPSCPVCGVCRVHKDVPSSLTLGELIDDLASYPKLQLVNPSVRGGGKTLYMEKGPLKKLTEKNLSKPMGELTTSGTELSVTDINGSVVMLVINFSDDNSDSQADS